MTERLLLFRRLGLWLQRRRNGVVFGMLSVGVPGWLLLTLRFGDFGIGWGFAIYTLIVCLLAGAGWGWTMWKLMPRLLSRQSEPRREPEHDA
jgi:hypothetical protein